jgi:nucleoside-diphosphate-sugar epimerase
MSADDGRVVSNFIVQSLRNEPLTIYGDGNQTRCFCYVSDLIDGLVALFFKESVYEPVNLGNPQPIHMNQLAQEVIKLTVSKSTITNLPLPSDDPRQREPNINKAKYILGWEPKVNRATGLRETIKYFEKILVKFNNSNAVNQLCSSPPISI